MLTPAQHPLPRPVYLPRHPQTMSRGILPSRLYTFCVHARMPANSSRATVGSSFALINMANSSWVFGTPAAGQCAGLSIVSDITSKLLKACRFLR